MKPLTKRQLEVAELVGDDLGYKAIAAQLAISEDRVCSIVKRVAVIVAPKDNDLKPYKTVFLWIRQRRWELAQAAQLPPASRLTPSVATDSHTTDGA